MITLDRLTQLNFIGDVFEPRYSTNDVLIACWKVKRSKLDIKFRFSKVNSTSEYAGTYFLSRSAVTKCRKKYDNNGRECYVVSWDHFTPLEFSTRSLYD